MITTKEWLCDTQQCTTHCVLCLCTAIYINVLDFWTKTFVMLLIHLIDWVSNFNCLAKYLTLTGWELNLLFSKTNYWTISWQVMQPFTFMFWCYARYYRCTHTCAANISLAYCFLSYFYDIRINIVCIPFFSYTWQLFAISSRPHILTWLPLTQERFQILAVIFNFDHRACKRTDMCMCFKQLKITSKMFG